MKVILKAPIENLGTIGDVVNVSPGYMRNYLLPQDKAMLSNPKQIKKLEHTKKLLQKKLAKLKEEKEQFKKTLEGLTITIRRKAGAKEKLFGSVTTQDIEEAIKSQGITIDRKNIQLNAPLKKLGVHKVPYRVMESVVAELNVAIVTEV